MMKWRFPENISGSMTGLNDSGIETYKIDPIASLAKEICQNSLDEVLDETKPVEVHFQTFVLQKYEFLEGIQEMFQEQKKFWDSYYKYDKRVPQFFKRALDILSQNEMLCLRISDFNTKGLTDSHREDIGSWNRLVKSTGVSDKEGSKLGSFGIGKFATFANSLFHMVFYSTKDKDGREAFQGVTKLSSFRKEDKRMYDGNGYFSEDESFNPVRRWISLDPEYTRRNPGTDIYIVAFREYEEWEKELIKSLVDNFLFSFLWNKMTVKVNDLEINQKNIHGIINELISINRIDKLTVDYYKTLTEEGSNRFTSKILTKDDIELVLKLDRNMNRRVAIVRSNGMKIFDKKNISTRVSFSGVLTLTGLEINEYFKSIENPRHSAWEPKRATDENLANNRIRKVSRFIKSSLNSLIEENRETQVDAEGVGEFLPDFNELAKESTEIESLTDRIVKPLEVKRSKTRKSTVVDGDGDDSKRIPSDDIGVFDEEGEQKVDGPGDNGGGGGGNCGGETEPGRPDSEGDRRIVKRYKVQNINVNYRLIKTSSGYIIIIIPKFDIFQAELEIHHAGETVKEKIKIKNAFLSDETLLVKNNAILIPKLVGNKKNKIRFTISDTFNLAMEVTLYETRQ